jgi:formylglycine-generating enzyme required for sulfatase activity
MENIVNGGNTSFIEINGTYTKPESRTLLTTGATERNSSMNIYDLAGNEYEWTLEFSSDINSPCSYRGGGYSNTGLAYPASSRRSYWNTGSDLTISLRVALY